MKKYVPGGVAARVRGWVVESANVSGSATRGRGTGEGEGRVVVVMEVAGGGGSEGVGMRVVRDGAGRGWMLIGEGRRRGRKGMGVRKVEGEADEELGVGDVVRVREPMWEVELVGERWWVCVDWGVE